MEPPTTVPRRATTLTRLWRSTDAADSIAQFLPTEALSALPKIAKSFERDHWRLLGALMRRAKRGTAAACKSAVLSTLQMGGRDVHLREDWADQARFDEKWTVFGCRGYRRDEGEPEHVEYTARVSQGTLVFDRITPRNSSYLTSRFNIPGAGDRCCVHRFRVALTYTPNNEGINGCGSGFQLVNVNRGLKGLFIIYVAYENSSFQLRWRHGLVLGDTHTILKTVPTQHTFLIDATLDWRTATARVTVDGTEFEEPLHFRRLPVTAMCFSGVEDPGQHTLGPFDVLYSNMPPPLPCVRFEGDPKYP